MTPFLATWSQLAVPILEKALATKVVLSPATEDLVSATFVVYGVEITGDMAGRFLVKAEKQALESLPGLGADAVLTLWPELFERIGVAVAEELASRRGFELIASTIELPETTEPDGVAFMLVVGEARVPLLLVDGAQRKILNPSQGKPTEDSASSPQPSPVEKSPGSHSGMDLLLDVELEASLRFGSREMPLSQIVELGPGDVVQLDRHVSDPVDLIVGDKIVARGEVVLINGNFGLRVTEVSEPQKRLESIRCLF